MILKIKNILSVFLVIINSIVIGQVPFEHVIIDENGPTNPWGKAVGDLNKDGFPDLLTGGRMGNLVWYRYPNWEKEIISGDEIKTDIEVSDINGDEIPDVLAIGHQSLNWYQGPDWKKHIVRQQIVVHDIEIEDLNNDSKPDIVARNQKNSTYTGDTIHIFIQGETPDTWNYSSLPCPEGEGLQVIDINIDGRPDLLIGGIWYENTGDMDNWINHSYAPSWEYPHTYISTGDINGDSLNDVVLAPAEPGGGGMYKIAWYEQPKDVYEEWTEHIIIDEIETVCHFVGAADFNNDSKIDIAVAEMHQSIDPDEIFLLLNQDNGETWQKQLLATTGSHSMKIVDIGLDGDFDLYGANWNDNTKVELWQNYTMDTFSTSSNSLDKWQRHVIDDNKDWKSLFIASEDLNGDSLPEIITGAWWYTNPGVSEGEWVRHDIGSPLNNMALTYDFDSDGDIDILGTEGGESLANANFVWARNDGAGNFTVFDNIEPAQGDFLQGAAIIKKGEESPYLVALSWHGSGQGVQTLTVPSNPSEEIWTWKKISSFSQDECLSAGDIDLDGEPDLLLGTTWLKNNLNSWQLDTIHFLDEEPDRNKLADVNNDSLPDAVIGFQAISTLGKLAWYERPDSISAEWKENVIDFIVGPMSLDATDMDEDGDIDIVAGEHNLAEPDSAGMYIYENLTGNGKVWARHLVYKGDEHHDGAITTDIDNDGDLDILSIGWGHKKVLLYENLEKTVTPNSTINKKEVPTKLKVYPNPASDKITIDLKTQGSGAINIKVFNSNGIMVYHNSKNIDGRLFTAAISTQRWETGIYFIKIQTREEVLTDKFLILSELK
ncbi:T9SS type A sorting domain-containing protein [Maribellus comscasis]|uniref:T9SS type A sorting domain-containing protein n=1 Tax=Maribellus comscasis TaxID=2681766 RepID=A0A6I6JSG7_9BACT|nr:T9SS type A sorting domain-containing protein [Maribellus comscasis]QGY45956.1 T9SS type A sorting domain-containing protein [Maribellus comscasis]